MKTIGSLNMEIINVLIIKVETDIMPKLQKNYIDKEKN